MAGGLLVYSGLVTKTKAMHGALLGREEIIRLSEYETVEELIGFLREYGSYAPIYQSHEGIAHRAQVEAVIGDSLYLDYAKLYRFASGEQRRGLEIIFMRYEVNVLKSCLERAIQGSGGQSLPYRKLFFARHAAFDAEALAAAGSVQELLQAVAGTRYEEFLRRLTERPGATYADCAVQFDIFYYKTAWKRMRHLKDEGMREIYAQILGTEIDWQNIMWMYRSKRFFERSEADIQAHLIPIQHRLTRSQVKALLAAENPEMFVEALGRTAYFTGKHSEIKLGDDITFGRVMEKTYQRLCQKHPMSIASVLKYLYDKENEIDALTTVLEGVRYRIPAREIQDLVLMTVV